MRLFRTQWPPKHLNRRRLTDDDAIRYFSSASGYALIIVDVQKDFLPGGALGVPDGDQVVPTLNRYICRFAESGLPVFATRDWHPPDHCSFEEQGGIWPPHCVAGTSGAEFAAELVLPDDAQIVSKASEAEVESYSGFGSTDLHERLQQAGVRRIFVGGLATDFCVKETVKDAVGFGYAVVLLADAIRGADRRPGDSHAALEEMFRCGVQPAQWGQISDK